jgi:hypothetical protein
VRGGECRFTVRPELCIAYRTVAMCVPPFTCTTTSWTGIHGFMCGHTLVRTSVPEATPETSGCEPRVYADADGDNDANDCA